MISVYKRNQVINLDISRNDIKSAIEKRFKYQTCVIEYSRSLNIACFQSTLHDNIYFVSLYHIIDDDVFTSDVVFKLTIKYDSECCIKLVIEDHTR